MNWTPITVFVVLFALVTVACFVAGRWRRGAWAQLNDGGLAGRRLGTVITWFLLGGDVYTAYTFIAVPALVFGTGALGFFALPYTIIVYPLVFLILPRMWSGRWPDRRHRDGGLDAFPVGGVSAAAARVHGPRLRRAPCAGAEPRREHHPVATPRPHPGNARQR